MLDSIRGLLDFDSDPVPASTIKTASFKRLSEYEKCAFRAKLMFVDKVPEPERPLKEGQTEAPNERGIRVHNAAEAYLRGGVELVPELNSFKREYERLRELFAEGKVSVEGEWGFNDAWQPVGWMSADVWMRIKLDAMVWITDDHILVQDLKTGRREGNEIKHADQMTLYAVAALMKYPQIKQVTVELWYCDVDELARMQGTRESFLRHLKRYNQRIIKMTQATEFKPNPNKFTCKWCRYGPGGNGACAVGV